MASYYFDDSIGFFFESNTSATRQQCDDFARAHAEGQLRPVQIQGTFSYTVAVGTTKIFQFRTLDSSFDMHVMSLAKAIHPQFVASCKYHGIIGQSRPLHIYEMDHLPGMAYIVSRNIAAVQPPDAVFRQRNTVEDLASFFAQSWNSNHQLDPRDTATLLMEFQSKFDLLAQSLPSRFASSLREVRRSLPSLFSGMLPFVLNHEDLCEMNILINSKTGHMTGIVDWAEARILPFGFALWSLENILGYMDSTGWHYYDNRHELEGHFWQTFRAKVSNISEVDMHLIRRARMTGLFCRYGFVVEGKILKGVIDPTTSSSLVYLDAFCTNGI
ncbi:hypothetical protein H634G_10873 [Metarhizium anisopliae BRIP 53293]|uniref:Aminoglycoside phosphotransferase domain-containing protein n=2 Tax=Opisthokonta TaxID=33154 RepID=A0A0D9NIH8_METAN|nr:hypothetical protein H634G_10873 [Metarhizium anisopliae BRIP 53293]KJK88375.1 hypothetical protein H633G_07765 [Metarhizium anisopliae BRIP 53284]